MDGQDVESYHGLHEAVGRMCPLLCRDYVAQAQGYGTEEDFSTRAVPKNVWLGVTVECRSSIFRIDYLRDIPASVRFLSCEPLVESLGEMNLSNIDWVIVGGESGPQARPMKAE